MGIISIPLGWIMAALYSLIENYGIVLILFTVLVKVLMFPLSVKQQKATAKMAVFQPKIQEIQKKYENNKEKQQEELMKLYQTHGYNPMSGCLPMVLPLIILFGLIDVIYRPLKHILHIGKDTITAMAEILTTAGVSVTKGREDLAIITNIVNYKDALIEGGIDSGIVEQIVNFDFSLFGMDLSVVPTFGLNWLVIVPLLSGLTAFLSSWISMKMNPATANQAGGGSLKMMMYTMPLLSVWICFSFPIGMGFYWILSNILAGVQTVILYKIYSPERYKKEFEEKMALEAEKKKEERAQRKQMKENKENKETLSPEEEKIALTEKEINRRRLAEARKRDAEKYGEEYVEVTDKDLM